SEGADTQARLALLCGDDGAHAGSHLAARCLDRPHARASLGAVGAPGRRAGRGRPGSVLFRCNRAIGKRDFPISRPPRKARLPPRRDRPAGVEGTLLCRSCDHSLSWLPAYIYAYAPAAMPGGNTRIYILAAMDLAFVASMFLMGGEFWEKV